MSHSNHPSKKVFNSARLSSPSTNPLIPDLKKARQLLREIAAKLQDGQIYPDSAAISPGELKNWLLKTSNDGVYSAHRIPRVYDREKRITDRLPCLTKAQRAYWIGIKIYGALNESP